MKINTLGWNRLRYSFYAPFYDLTDYLIGGARRQALAQVSVKRGERVLLMGCGTGLDLTYLPAGVDVVAIDISPAMVERTQRRADVLGMDAMVQEMNAEQLDLMGEQFDVVILHLVLAVIPDPVACIREAERVLRPGGRISILDKFVPANQSPTLLRRTLNLITNLFFSDITRSLEPLLAMTGLHVTQNKAALLNGAFRAVIATKNEAATGSKSQDV